jgi:hypothetical protein
MAKWGMGQPLQPEPSQQGGALAAELVLAVPWVSLSGAPLRGGARPLGGRGSAPSDGGPLSEAPCGIAHRACGAAIRIGRCAGEVFAAGGAEAFALEGADDGLCAAAAG